MLTNELEFIKHAYTHLFIMYVRPGLERGLWTQSGNQPAMKNRPNLGKQGTTKKQNTQTKTRWQKTSR